MSGEQTLTFRPLGYDHGTFYYYSYSMQKVVALKPGEHRKENLFMLATLNEWRKMYGDEDGKIAWQSIIDSTLQACISAGIYNPLNVRGRGIWVIDGEPVIHYGAKVFIKGRHLSPREISGKHIYETGADLRANVEPAKNADFTHLQSVLSDLHFQNKDMPTFLSGWIVCAMAAGAIHWRPHFWITGRRGSGKSAIMEFLNRFLGNLCEFYSGETTEAGIRQDLRHDCRAVIFDEAEPLSPTLMNKIQGVLALARQASSNEQGKIAKGTATGRGITFVIRSCFCMASINTALIQAADKSRFTMCEMGDPLEKKAFNAWEFKYQNIFTKEYVAALHQYIGENAVTLQHNAKVFSQAVGSKFKDNRTGDQYGTLLAGAHLLTSKKKITLSEAQDWLMDIEFPIDETTQEDNSDEMELWNYILTRRITFKKNEINNYGSKTSRQIDATIQELIDVASRRVTPAYYAAEDAERELCNCGLKIKDDYIAVSTSHAGMADLISRSRFSGLKWSGILARMKGAKSSQKTLRFGAISSKATFIQLQKRHYEDDESENVNLFSSQSPQV